SPAQGAVLAAFSPEAYDEADARVAELARVREIALEGAPRLGWGPIAPADGAFYLYGAVPLGEYAASSAWAAALLEEARVARVPGSGCRGANGGSFVRLSFAAGAEAVAGAMERIEAFSPRWPRARRQLRRLVTAKAMATTAMSAKFVIARTGSRGPPTLRMIVAAATIGTAQIPTTASARVSTASSRSSPVIVHPRSKVVAEPGWRTARHQAIASAAIA